MLLTDSAHFQKTCLSAASLAQPRKMRSTAASCLVLLLAILFGCSSLWAQNGEFPLRSV